MPAPDETIRIVHVDDDPSVAELAAEYLERENDRFEVVTETDAGGALDRLADGRFDGVVSDFDMPAMDGLELLAAVREEYPDLPFVLFTGKGTEEIASEAISAGVTDYLQKGTGADQYTVLANRLENAVERFRAEQRADRRRRVNRLVNEVNQALVRASTRGEVETSACRLIDRASPYAFACIGATDVDAPRVRSQAVDDSLEAAILAAVESAGSDVTDLGARAVHEGTIVVENDVQDAGDGPLVALARRRDCPAVAAVPLTDDGRPMGLLAVFASDPGVFDRRERRLLAELGSDIERAIREVEMREQLRRTKERFRKVFEQSNDAIMVVDMDEEAFLEVNPAACEMLGYDREELLDLHPRAIHPDDIDRVRESFVSEVLEEGSGWTDDLTCLTKDGESVPTEISGAVLQLEDEEQQPSTMVAILRDIAEREAYRRDLERQVDRLEEFASVLSHDLRSPLNVAVGRLEMATEDVDSEPLGDVGAALERIDELVERTLTLARSGQHLGETDPVDLGEVADRCWGNVVGDGAELVVSNPGTVIADRERVEHLFENLFRNAVEHGSTSPRSQAREDAVEHGSTSPQRAEDAVEHGGPGVTIRVGALEDGFFVADDGPGIPEERREDVLEAGVSTTSDGTGLGLAIVNRIAEAHGWTVTVTESRDDGARFGVTGVDVPADGE
jgi:PAS domain S-box-containing protein